MRLVRERGGIGNQHDVDSLLLRPSTDEDEELCFRVLVDAGPFLSLTLELRSPLKAIEGE
jgi:hypothetical protein